jgi:peptide/nickel transport system ATP-binding protein
MVNVDSSAATAPGGARSSRPQLRPESRALLTVDHLVVEYRAGRGGKVHAVSDVSFDVLPGETLGLVGESGCGKSSVGRAITQLPRPTSGRVVLGDIELTTLSQSALRPHRRRLQMVFQDSIGSLNPRRRARDIVAEGLRVLPERSADPDREVREVLAAVGFDVDMVGGRLPRELSGGQAQRIAIARALIVRPDVIICDEPVSSLDVLVQAQILNLLHEMKERFNLTLLFISHDLAVMKNVSDRIAVMYLGKLCEIAPSEALYTSPRHPYTRALLDAVPEPAVIDENGNPIERRPALGGELPSPMQPPSGCRFRTRCPRATEICAKEEPRLERVEPDNVIACHHPLSVGTNTSE